MIDHLSKWIELVTLLDKASEEATYALLDMMFSHFGASKLINYCTEFQVLCDKVLIDHQITSRDHSESNDLAKRVVQTVKSTLCKYDLQK